ncbi:hypothetical protein GCM10007913_29720 [Devosia yakushimensis]|uniref:Tex-like protein N-terminal domain-containing protein n=1 Tax=Devosia yakushimensis TaxID=470028 RepID=A0ABQ5UG18_9HYPH|nr:hypothetical protein GCM10007913_29720 [Devosia yakushimensis]
MADLETRIATQIAAEIAARPPQVLAAVELLDGGATVPFVARYRKEVTGGLDDTQLRLLAERLAYLRELEARRATIIKSIEDQGKLTPALTASIMGVATKAELEDLYLPYKPKRRTKAEIARERGLGPLAEAILVDRRADPVALAGNYITPDVPGTKEALEGARDIVIEGLTEKMPPCSGNCAGICATRPCCGPVSSPARKRQAPNSRIISTMPSAGPRWPGTVPWP